jgi:hypothetical protein
VTHRGGREADLSDLDKYRNPKAQAPGCGLNELLTQLGSEGSHDSEGHFTLSLEDALEKLKQFQLGDPNYYVLNLVSVATLAGAGSLNVLLGKSEDTIEFDGNVFTRSQLENIFVSQEAVVKELAVALTAVKGLGYESIKFESEGGLFWEDKTPEFFDAGQVSNTLTLVKKPEKKMFRELEKWPRVWSDRSETALRRSCQLAPLYLKFNHRLVNKSMLHLEAPAFKVEHADLKLPGILKIGRKETEIVTLPSNFRYSAIVCGDIDKVMQEGGPSKRVQHWHFVFRGISYTRTSLDLNMAGLGGIVISDGFSKDISHTDIVENEFFQKVVEDLRDRLVTYVQEFLTRKALQRNEAKDWFGATTLVGQLLSEAGETREAARVDAWTYGHRAKLKLLEARQCRRLVERYDQPLVFLLDYFYWNSLLAIDQQLQLLGGEAPVAYEKLLLPWIEGAPPEWVIMLYEFLLPAFPDEIKWNTLVPLEKFLEAALSPEDFREKFLVPLVKKFESITSGVEDLTSLCQVACYLDSRGYLDFEVWLEKAFETGLVLPLPYVRELLARSDHKLQAEAVLQRLDADEKRGYLRQADAEFVRYMNHPESSPKDIETHLKSALAHTNNLDERSELLAFLCLVDARVQEQPIPGAGAWQEHRAALVLASFGSFKQAREIHEYAHLALSGHWFSHLLLGDNSRALGDRKKANGHYTESLDLRQNVITQVALIETSDADTQQEQWLSLARSLSVSKLDSYFAYREALNLPVLRDFASWVKLRALTSYAELLAGDVPQVDIFTPVLSLSLRSPSVILAHIRALRRKGEAAHANRILARFRLVCQLSQSVPLKLRWKAEFQGSEENLIVAPTEPNKQERSVGLEDREVKHPKRFKPLR